MRWTKQGADDDESANFDPSLPRDDELITTRGEAWLCVINAALTSSAIVAFSAMLVVDPRSPPLVSLGIWLFAWVGATFAWLRLEALRHRRDSDLFWSWWERKWHQVGLDWWRRERPFSSLRRSVRLLRDAGHIP
jgi:hypothetical protein